MMSLQTLIFLILFNFYCIQSTPYFSYLHDKRTDRPRKYCGLHLRTTMSIVCNGIYVEKRTLNDLFDYENQIDNDMNTDEINNIYPFMYKASSLSLLPKKREPSSGINEECCEKPCTKSFMKENYCG
ncbi:unnamed protein product [Psylliodes chrysocephalus]|uniref:Insulin-like domain-containing protein n=1 Tax=Psylliodes chrysocephalus TaxID=3402493 RepID=A0A9P0G3U5_9CUCU|nr:unnamed protein product [Psylliodes chrysocephala]